MKLFHFATLLVLLSWLPAPIQADPVSAPSFAAAKAKAKSEKRLLFLMFTSSDCPHCRKFNTKVLSTEVFQTFARENLTFMIYDVDAYAALPEAERKLALSMEEKYGVEKMPAIVVFSPEGKEHLRTQGYRGTAAEKIVTQLKSFLP